MLLLKNISGAKVYLILFTRLCLDGVAALKFLAEGKPKHFLAILRAHFNFYRLIPKILETRKQTAGTKKYAAINSIVTQYFVRNKKYYSDLF